MVTEIDSIFITGSLERELNILTDEVIATAKRIGVSHHALAEAIVLDLAANY